MQSPALKYSFHSLIHSTMPPKARRVSVVRISRQGLNPANPLEQQEEVRSDPSTIQLPPPQSDPLVTRIKPRPLPEREPSPIPVKSRPLPESDPPTVHVKPRSPPKARVTREPRRTKPDIFSADLPQTSDSKSDDLNPRTDRSSRPSPPIQQQPYPVPSWIKSSSHHLVRPEFNWVGTNQWSHKLFAFSEDSNMCCYACACWCCFRHELSTMMGEHWCLWFIDMLPLVHLRTKFRQQYAIQGSIAGDCCAATFCPLCVALQIANEARDYGHRIFS